MSVGNFDVTSLAMAFDYRAARDRARRPGRQRARPEAALAALQRPADRARAPGRADRRPAPARAARSRRRASEARFLANPVSLDYRGQLAEGVEDHASMAPLAVSATSSLVSLAHRLVALELIIAAQAVDLRGGPERLGAGTARAYARRPRVRRQPDRRDRVERRRRRARDARRRRPARAPRRPRRRRAPGAVRARAARDLSDARGSPRARRRAARDGSASSRMS